MNVIIRGGLVALSLAAGVVQLANAAAYSTSQEPAVNQPVPQDAASVPAGRAYAGQPVVTPGTSDRAGAGSMRMPGRAATIQSGNDFNFMEGGGG
jgi:hypothetical protein